MRELELIENPYYGGGLKSQAMSLAAQYREEGLDSSEALSQAWDEVRGESDYEEDYDDSMELVVDKPRRRKIVRNPDVEDLRTYLLYGAAGYLIWCAIKYYQTKQWSWKPWVNVTVSRLIAEAQQLTTPKPEPKTMPVYNETNRWNMNHQKSGEMSSENIQLILP